MHGEKTVEKTTMLDQIQNIYPCTQWSWASTDPPSGMCFCFMHVHVHVATEVFCIERINIFWKISDHCGRGWALHLPHSMLRFAKSGEQRHKENVSFSSFLCFYCTSIQFIPLQRSIKCAKSKKNFDTQLRQLSCLMYIDFHQPTHVLNRKTSVYRQ